MFQAGFKTKRLLVTIYDGSAMMHVGIFGSVIASICAA